MPGFLRSVWSATVDFVPGQELQILPRESERRTVARLWQRLVFVCVMFFGPLLLLDVVSAYWLRLLLGVISISFCLSPFFAAFGVFMFYGLPGIRLDEDGLFVKAAGCARISHYLYRDVVHIRQMTASVRGRARYYLELELVDGSTWRTAQRPDWGIRFLARLAEGIKEKCGCPISPVFGIQGVQEGNLHCSA